jgi:hypothetical protein
MCDKPSTSNPGWTKNTLKDHTGVSMSRGQNVAADGELGGWIVWVKMLRGRFVGGRIVSAPLQICNSATSKLNSQIILVVKQGPKRSRLMKKARGRTSIASVPLVTHIYDTLRKGCCIYRRSCHKLTLTCVMGMFR